MKKRCFINYFINLWQTCMNLWSTPASHLGYNSNPHLGVCRLYENSYEFNTNSPKHKIITNCHESVLLKMLIIAVNLALLEQSQLCFTGDVRALMRHHHTCSHWHALCVWDVKADVKCSSAHASHILSWFHSVWSTDIKTANGGRKIWKGQHI